MPYKSPEKARAYNRDYARLRRVGAPAGQTPCQTPIPADFRLKTASDVLTLIAEQVAAVRADPGVLTIERARTVGFLAGVALRAIEAGDLAARLEALEGALKARRHAA